MLGKTTCVLLVWAALVPATVVATPQRVKEGGPVVHWPKDSCITVYIPKDPRGKGRDAALAAAIEVWNKNPTLKAQNVMFKAKIGENPPTEKKNSITVAWKAEKPGGNDGETLPQYDKDGVLSSATIEIFDDPDDFDKDSFRRLMIHELGHGLGLDHPKSDDPKKEGESVMEPVNVLDDLTDSDREEVKATYLASASGSDVKVNPDVKKEDGAWLYRYDAQWLSGGELAVFQVQVGEASLWDITPADGWEVDDFASPSDVNLDGLVLPPRPRTLGFIHSSEKSYLGEATPFLSFSFRSNLAPGESRGFLNGYFATLAPVPEPTSWSLLIAGFLAVGGTLRLRRHRLT